MKLRDAARLVGLKRPVRVARAELGFGTGGSFQGPDKDGNHLILFDVANVALQSIAEGVEVTAVLADVLFHEMTHALQLERDFNNDQEAMDQHATSYYCERLQMPPDELHARWDDLTTDDALYDVYKNYPLEKEARDNAARLAARHTIEPD